ncbi:DUF3127 domain-containing protein [Epilithonimonas hominis]|uniref:DUF3127 domain-containing protein n=1 Tax=Epilithonimonas hominis TaxID=420404 RepID=UPI00289E4E44|nr:DUF3127 domain-containing protein [Epilithonimonas hominis]
MTQTGILLNRSDIKTTESGFKSIEFYLDCKTFDQNTGQEYPNKLKFQLIGDRVSLLEQYQRGERVTVSFNIKGREYDKQDGTKGHIQNLNVWKIEKVQNFQQSAQSTTSTSQQSSNSGKEDEDDDLPF